MATDPSLIFSAQVTGLEQSVRSQWARAQRGIRSRPIDISIRDKASLPLGHISSKASEFDGALKAATDRVLGFGIAAGVFFQVQRAVQELVRSAIDVEQALARINVNLGQSDEGLKRFSKEIFNIARNTGQTFGEAAKAAEELARQGLGAEQTTQRLRDALILSRLAVTDSISAVESLTAAVNTYGSEALTTTDVINRMVAVDTSFAVSTKDLSDALSRVGSSAAEAGVSFNELLAIVTAVQQTTARGGAVIGNSFKTIFTRIQRPAVLQQLEDLGVAVKDVGGNALPAIQILTNLARTYDTLSEAQRAIIAEQVGGVFQINILKATLGDLNKEYSIYNRALGVASGATDEAIRKNEQLNKTLATLLNSTAQGFAQLFASIGESGGAQLFTRIIGSVDSFLKFLTGSSGEEAGKTFGEKIVQGITNVLTGPGFLLASVVLGKAVGKVLIQAGKALTVIAQGNNAAAARAKIQLSINNLLGQATVAEQAQFAAARSIAQQKEVILGIQTRITNETLRQLAAQRALQAAFIAPAPGIRGFVGGTTTPLRAPRNAAGGYVPPVANEMAAIKRGVGGAKPSAKPVVIPNFAFGGGKRGPIVANSNEYIVPNYAGGGSAIFNPDMVKSMGLPSGAKKINAAGGYVPNFVNPSLFAKGLATEAGRGAFGDAFKLKDKNVVTKKFRYGKDDLIDEYIATKYLSETPSDNAIKFLGPIGNLDRSIKRGYIGKPFTNNVGKVDYASGLAYIIQNGARDMIGIRTGLYADVHNENFGLNERANKFVNNIKRNAPLSAGRLSPRAQQIDSVLRNVSSSDERRNTFLKRLGKRGINFEVFDPVSSFHGIRNLAAQSPNISSQMKRAGISANGYIPNFVNPFLRSRGLADPIGKGAFGTAYKLKNRNLVTKEFNRGVEGDLVDDFITNKFLGELPNQSGIKFVPPIGNLKRSLQRGYIGKPYVKNVGKVMDNSAIADLVENAAGDTIFDTIGAPTDIHAKNFGFNDKADKFLRNIGRNAESGNMARAGRINRVLRLAGFNREKRTEFFKRLGKKGIEFSVFDPIAEFGGVPAIARNSPKLKSELDSVGFGFARGYVPNFAKQNPLFKAIERERQAGVNPNKIYVDRDSRVRGPSNPLGLLVANKIDEPISGSQGVNRSIRQGINPKFAGMAKGFVPNFVDQQGMFGGGDRLRDARTGRFISKSQMGNINAALKLYQQGLQEGSAQLKEQAKILASTVPLNAKSRTQLKFGFELQDRLFKDRKAAEKAKIAQDKQIQKQERQAVQERDAQDKRRSVDFDKAQKELQKGQPKIPKEPVVKPRTQKQIDAEKEKGFSQIEAADKEAIRAKKKADAAGIKEQQRFQQDIEKQQKKAATEKIRNQRRAEKEERKRIADDKKNAAKAKKDAEDQARNARRQTKPTFPRQGGSISDEGAKTLAAQGNRAAINVLASRNIASPFPRISQAQQAQNVAAANAAAKAQQVAGSGPTALNPKILKRIERGLGNVTADKLIRGIQSKQAAGKPASSQQIKTLGQVIAAQVKNSPEFRDVSREDIRNNPKLRQLFSERINERFIPIVNANDQVRQQRAMQTASDRQAQRIGRADEALNKRSFSTFRSRESNERFLTERGFFKSDRDKTLLKGNLDARQDRRAQRIQGASLGAAFILPFLSGLLPQGEGGTTKGIALGATSGAAQGAALGALGGLPGLAIGATVGGLIGAFGKLTQSAQELNDKFDKTQVKKEEEVQALARFLTIQEQINNTEDPDTRRRLEDEQFKLRGFISSEEARNIAQTTDPKESGRLFDKFAATVESTRAGGEAANLLRTLPTTLKDVAKSSDEVANVLSRSLGSNAVKNLDLLALQQIGGTIFKPTTTSVAGQGFAPALPSPDEALFKKAQADLQQAFKEAGQEDVKISRENINFLATSLAKATAKSLSDIRLKEERAAEKTPLIRPSAFLNFSPESGQAFRDFGQTRTRGFGSTPNSQSNRDNALLNLIKTQVGLGVLNEQALPPEIQRQKEDAETRVARVGSLEAAISVLEGLSSGPGSINVNTDMLRNRDGDPIQRNILTVLEKLASTNDEVLATQIKSLIELIKIKDDNVKATEAEVKRPTAVTGGIVPGVKYSTFAGGFANESGKTGVISRTAAPIEAGLIGPAADAARKARQDASKAAMDVTDAQRKEIQKQSEDRNNKNRRDEQVTSTANVATGQTRYLGRASAESFASDKERARAYFSAGGGFSGSTTNLRNQNIAPVSEVAFERAAKNIIPKEQNTEFGNFTQSLNEIKNTFANTKLQAENTIKVDLVVSPDALQLASQQNLDMITQMLEAKLSEFQTQLSSLSSQVNRNAGTPTPPAPVKDLSAGKPFTITNPNKPSTRTY